MLDSLLMNDRLLWPEEDEMKAIKPTALALLALLMAAPAFADGRERSHDRGWRGDDRGSAGTRRGVDPRVWDRDERGRGWNRDRRPRREHFRDHPRSRLHGHRDRDRGWSRHDRREWRRQQRRWSRKHHQDRRDVIIISPFGGILGRIFD